MSTLCYTEFNTYDKDIINALKNERVLDFDYNEDTGDGTFLVKNGLGSIDCNKIADIATEHKSSFRFKCVGDYYFPYRDIFEFKDGCVVCCKSEKIEYNID